MLRKISVITINEIIKSKKSAVANKKYPPIVKDIISHNVDMLKTCLTLVYTLLLPLFK